MARITTVVAIYLSVLAIKANYTEDICSESNGRFILPGQCDAYIECTDGESEEKLCPDGLVFNEDNSLPDFPCQYPTVQVTCENRTKLQPAKPTAKCPHQFGMFRVDNSSSNCGKYRACANGRAENHSCPEGLAFNKQNNRCDWADEVPDCNAEEYLKFTCPNVTEDAVQDVHYYNSPHNCNQYFLCIDGRPRLNACAANLVYDEVTRSCSDYETQNRPECKPKSQPTP